MKQKLKITIVNRHRDDKIGGSELQCNFIAEELSDKGHDVFYVVPNGQGSYNRNYSVISTVNDGEKIAEAVISTNPDIVYWRYNKIHFYKAVKRIKKSGITVIFGTSSVGDVNPVFFKKKVSLRAKIKSLLQSFWNHRGFKFVDAVVVNNESHLHMLPPSKQVFIPNGMKEHFVPFEWSKPYCAWVGNLKQIKRPEKVVELAKALPEIDILMIGTIQEKNYEWVKDKSKLPLNLYYLGEKTPEEVNGILRSARIHIHTCFPEGFPNVFIQAWTQGTPSVSLGFDPGNLIFEKSLGYNAKDNMQDFTDYVQKLFQNRSLRNKYGQNAAEFAKLTFNIERSVTMLEKLMFSLVNK